MKTIYRPTLFLLAIGFCISCQIKYEKQGVSYFEESDWKTMIDFLIDVAERMEKAFGNPIKKMNQYVKNKK